MRQGREWLEQQASVADVICFLDFDGTLAPIVDRPGEARPLDGVVGLVEGLSTVIEVAVISGRGVEDVRQRLGANGIYYSGSHGLELMDPSGAVECLVDEALVERIDEAERALRRRFVEVEGVELERKAASIAVHYRRAPDRSSEVSRVLQKLAKTLGDEEHRLGIHEGKMVLELQPQIGRDKGTALVAIWEAIDPGRNRRPIYIGDDRTDEDAFEVIADHGEGAAILVASHPRPSHAEWRLDDPHAVKAWLKALASRLGIAHDEPRGHGGGSDEMDSA